MFLVSLGEVQATNIMNYDAITKCLDMQLQHKSELEDKKTLFSFQDITDHCIIKGSKSIYEVIVDWEDGSVTWNPVS